MPCDQNVTAVLFLAAISGYDQGLIEDRDSVMRHPQVNNILSDVLSESNARSSHAV